MLIRLTTACNTKIKLPASQITFLDSEVKKDYKGAVVVVKWSACSPSFPTIRVRIPLKPTVFSTKYVFEKMRKNRQLGQTTVAGLTPRWALCMQGSVPP